MPKFRIIVQELHCEVPSSPKPENFVGEAASGISVTPIREIFSQTFPEQDFDMTSFVLAINKRKRVRKARAGKEEKS